MTFVDLALTVLNLIMSSIMDKQSRPNLFIIGAMKSGTSSLHDYLGNHPSIFMSNPKEPNFFAGRPRFSDLPLESFENDPVLREKLYLRLFENARDIPIVGESSTAYSKRPHMKGAPQGIFDFNPDSRFIYVMRDPIERAISHYWHMVRSHQEDRSLLQAVAEDNRYRDLSYYAMQLAPYLELFGRDRIMAFTMEEMKKDTLGVLQSIFCWLEVDATYVPQNTNEIRNRTPQVVRNSAADGLLHRVRYSRFWDVFGPWVPRSVRTVGRRLSDDRIDTSIVSTRETVEYLRPIQLSHTHELEELLGRRFPEWTTLFGSG